jgi:hypothetical protein
VRLATEELFAETLSTYLLEAKRMEFIKDLWRGDVKLVFTYWVVGIIGNALFNLVVETYLDVVGFFDVITEEKTILIWVFTAISTLYFLFSIVCVWRSANKYKGLSRYAVLAKAVVVIAFLRMIKQYVDIFGTA